MLIKIIEQQKQDIANQEMVLPYPKLLTMLKKSTRDFHGALSSKRHAFIFECKHYSPLEGKLRDDYSCTLLAKSYAQFADAISVLTNTHFFGGSYEHLKQVSETVDKPILCKDIVVSPYQVALARKYGADSILLMLSVLNDIEYLECLKQAHALNMSVVTEVFSEEEALRAIKLQAAIVVINHRNLHTMQIDMTRSIKLAPLFPKETIIIAASGIQSHQDVQALISHVHGFLIGTSLSKSQNIERTMRELVFGNIKICGLTTVADAKCAFDAGASLGGLIFAECSLRKISFNQALVLKTVPLQYIGVFVNQSIDLIINHANKLQLFAVQLHGYAQKDIDRLRQKLLPTCQIWLAINGNQPLPSTLPPHVDKFVVDNLSTAHLGGSGLTCDWNYINNSALLKHIVLAGGLSPHNVRLAKKLNTWALDFNSGVESSPGIKNHQEIKSLFAQLKTGEYYAA